MANPIEELQRIIVAWDQKQKRAVASGEQKIGDQEAELLAGLTTPASSQAAAPADNTLDELIKNSPFAKGAVKAIQETGYENAKEAISMGVPHEKLLSDLIAMRGTQGEAAPITEAIAPPPGTPAQPAASADVGQDLINQAVEIQKRKVGPLGLLKMLIPGVIPAMGMNEAMRSRELDTIAKTQKIAGKEPLQEKDRKLKEMELENTNAINNAAAHERQWKEIVSQENKISDQYIKDLEPMKLATDSLYKINAIYEDSLKGGDQNVNDFFLVYNAIKAADPNAVKEGEYKTVQDLMPILSRTLNIGNLAIKGETLNPKQRERIVNAATVQYNGLAKRFEPLAKSYEKRVRDYGGNPKRALQNYGAESIIDPELLKIMQSRGLQIN
jgi:hypothetical protein